MKKVVKKTDVVLVKRMKNLGAIGDVVSVRVGYAKNYLLPQGIALRATEENREYFNEKKSYFEEMNEKSKAEAEVVGAKLKDFELVMIRMASENGSLYGSVTRRDVADELHNAGFDINSNQVELNNNLKELGYFDVDVHVHPDVVVRIFANIARTKDDALKQSKAYLKQQQDKAREEKELAEKKAAEAASKQAQKNAAKEKDAASSDNNAVS